MKRFNDFEDDIYKCSRCGLCQSVCPVYKATLNECGVSRAKFNMLNGILRGDLSFNRKIKSYLDLCTGCNACKKFCPSAIDVVKIFIAAKQEYYKTNKLSFIDRFLSSYFLFKSMMFIGGFFCKVSRYTHFYCLTEMFQKLILKFGIWGKRFVLADSFSRKNFVLKNKNKSISKTKKAVYFKGCFNHFLNSETADAVRFIFDSSDIELIEKNFECCGVSYLNDGMVDKFVFLAQKNLALLGDDYDYLLTDCASCNSVLKDYKLFVGSKEASMLAQKTISVVQLISSMKFVSKKHMNITFHMPCHEDSDVVKILKNIENINYVEAADYNKCCGFSGKFALQNGEISREISRKKAKSFVDTKADIILTTCPACMLGLRQGLIELSSSESSSKKLPEVMNLFVFLAKYCC